MKFIFEVRIKPGKTAEQYIQAWRNGSTIIQKGRGAQGTKLYHKTGDTNSFIAIATWESKDARDKAMKELERADPQTKEIIEKHKEYGEINILGAFDEPPQSVDPDS